MTNKAHLLKKFGSEEAITAYYKEIGKKGGQAQVAKGFALWDKDKLRELSVKAANKKHGKETHGIESKETS